MIESDAGRGRGQDEEAGGVGRSEGDREGRGGSGKGGGWEGGGGGSKHLLSIFKTGDEPRCFEHGSERRENSHLEYKLVYVYIEYK